MSKSNSLFNEQFKVLNILINLIAFWWHELYLHQLLARHQTWLMAARQTCQDWKLHAALISVRDLVFLPTSACRDKFSFYLYVLSFPFHSFRFVSSSTYALSCECMSLQKCPTPFIVFLTFRALAVCWLVGLGTRPSPYVQLQVLLIGGILVSLNPATNLI